MTKKIIPYEREHDYETVQTKINDFLKLQNLQYNTSVYGKTIKTHLCELTDHHGTSLCFGVGKGTEQSAYLGSICESLEHYFTQSKFLENNIVMLPTSVLYNQVGFSKDRNIQILQEENQPHDIACRTYYSVSTGEKIYYPLFATVPDYINNVISSDMYDYTVISKYCTNSGTAFGLSFNEALIHAINERVERDALSLFLIGQFLRKPTITRLNIVNQQSLPSHVKNLKEKCEQDINAKIIIIDITTDINISTYIAVLAEPSPTVKQMYGCGTSIMADHAISRALTELMQLLHLNDDQMQAEDANSISVLNQYPALYKAAGFQIYNNLSTAQYTDYKNDVASMPQTLADYTNILVEKLQAQDLEIYYAVNYFCNQTNVHVLNIIIPGLEYFNVLAYGNMVTPSDRGINYFNQGHF